MEFERVRKLKYKAAKDIFYNVLDICYNFTYNSGYYCSCRKFYGCPLEMVKSRIVLYVRYLKGINFREN